MSKGTRYGTTLNGHDVELVFDASEIVINKATLVVDGTDVRSEHVAVHSGMVGELTRAQLRTGATSGVDLTQR